jgi:hypothetical protein
MQQPPEDAPTSPGRAPAEGPEMELPGADRDDAIDRQPPDGRTPGDAPGRGPGMPDTPDADLPERLGRRIENGPNAGIAAGEPDLVPDVEVPEETM